ncbi:unnamed protein product [Bathycoccus prasinos]
MRTLKKNKNKNKKEKRARHKTQASASQKIPFFSQKPRDINSNPPNKNADASSKFSSSPKTFAEKFAMSLDDVSFVDGEDAYGDAPFMRDAMVHRPSPKKRASLDIDAVKAKRDEELTIYGFSKPPQEGQSKSSSVRSSFDDFFYGSRVPKAEEGEQRGHVLNNNRRAASVDLPHPQWEHKIIRELHRKELARDHPEAKFRSEK